MRNLVFQGLGLLREKPWVRRALLASVPFCVRPLDLSCNDQLSRLTPKNIFIEPALAAFFWGDSARIAFNYLLEKNPQEWGLSQAITGALACAAIYISAVLVMCCIAGVRWGGHAIFGAFFRTLNFRVQSICLRYFLISTAAWGLWWGVGVWFVTQALLQPHTSFAGYLAKHLADNPMAQLFLVLIYGLAAHLATRNRRLGLKAVYAGSGSLVFIVELTCCLFLLGLSSGLLYLARLN